MSNLPLIKFRDVEPLQDYYFDCDGNGYSVARLIDDTRDLKPFSIPIAALDLSGKIWVDCNLYEMGFHYKKVADADLKKPIILDWNGAIADGRHRIIKALVEGKKTIKAVRITWKITPCREASQ